MGTTANGLRQIIDVRGDAVPVGLGGPSDGSPLLWLHGEGVTSGWGELHDRLAERFRVYAPVLPGFGGTALPSWLDSADDVALHLADLCHQLGLDRVLVAGESLGGWMAANLAVWRPELVRGLALVSTLGIRPAEPTPDLFIKSGPEALSYLANSLDGSSVDPLVGDIELATALWVEQAAQARLMWERPYDRKLASRVHHITAAVHVIWGSADRVLPPSHGGAVAELFGAPLHTVAGAGHLISIDDPAALAATIMEAFA